MSNVELPAPLSAKDESCFAYPTMKDRLPVIVAKIADYLSRDKEAIIKEYQGQGVEDDLKSVIGSMSQLRHELMTNKPATPLCDNLPDAEAWNNDLQRKVEDADGEPMKWFDSAWLWMECYLYRRVQAAPNLTKHLKSLDVFGDQKRTAYKDSYAAVSTLSMYLLQVIGNIEKATSTDIERFYLEFLQISLWGNKCDLSISAGSDNSQTQNPVEQLSKLAPKILVNKTSASLEVLRKAKEARGGQAGPVAIVLDNAGFELVTDLCFAEFLIAAGLASSVHFHGKAMPWFISDVTEKDFHWVLETMVATNHIALSKFSNKWLDRLKDRTWTLQCHDFWTLPHDYSVLESVAPDLHSQLAQCDLVFFKGDLNYRKLVGDLQWDTTVNFKCSLRGFLPAPVCALRALKADVVVDMQPGQAERVAQENAKWMVLGEYAVISLAVK